MPSTDTPLHATERSAFIDANDSWSLDNETISKTFVFQDFSAATGFVVRVAIASELADHHPDIDIRWNKVTIALSTHSAGALTEKDTTLAIAIDDLLTIA